MKVTDINECVLTRETFLYIKQQKEYVIGYMR